MPDSPGHGKEKPGPRLDTGERRLALLLEHSQRLMAERDPAALLRHVAAAARDINQARIAGVGIMSDDGRRFEDLISFGLDEALVEELKRQMASTDHPARRVIETREVVSGTNPGAARRLFDGNPATYTRPAP